MILKKTALLFICLIGLLNVYGQEKKSHFIFPTTHEYIYGIQFNLDGQVILIADGSDLKLFNVASKTLIREFTGGHQETVMALDISDDQSFIVSGDKNGKMVIWDFAGPQLKTIQLSGTITDLDISPNKKEVFLSTTSNKAYLCEIPSGKVIREFNDHSDIVTTVGFSGANYFASGSADGTIKIYNTENYQLVQTIREHKSWIRSISFNREGNTILSVGDNGKIITWINKNGERFIQLDEKDEGFTWFMASDFHKDGKSFAVGNLKGWLKIMTPFGVYNYKGKNIIQDIAFQPQKGNFLSVAIATRGNGVVLINAKDLTLKKK